MRSAPPVPMVVVTCSTLAGRPGGRGEGEAGGVASAFAAADRVMA
jgi:hypothetical protein